MPTAVIPVIPGVAEIDEVEWAKNQAEYETLPALTYRENPSIPVTSRWSFSERERKAIAEGADVRRSIAASLSSGDGWARGCVESSAPGFRTEIAGYDSGRANLKMDLTAQYSVSEIYSGIQGEAGWAGVAMAFIRLAGCNVGKPYTAEARKIHNPPDWQERCTNWDGSLFGCDIDYGRQKTWTVEKILNTPEIKKANRVCLTGGEPFLQDIVPLAAALHHEKKRIHIETSGTFPVRKVMRYEPWITCSPKQGYLLAVLAAASEIKILVGRSFDEDKFLYEFQPLIHLGKIWFQPVDCADKDINTRRCMALVEKYPGTRISMQLQKIFVLR